ncbi:MAG: hypothetical protein IPJ14_04355 [Kineosporiaceae bacterium]|nr:hypothetical protein [Kineosporiaceae bacterium]MBK7621895.1 hypothetical protein [Kineosporiaceae bacterium]
MPVSALAQSTRTVAMTQVSEVNERLAAWDENTQGCLLITAELLGLTGLAIHSHVLDHAALKFLGKDRRRDQTKELPGSARLREVMATGDPSFPHLYALFGEPIGRRRLPARVRPDHMLIISSTLQLHGHHWGH